MQIQHSLEIDLERAQAHGYAGRICRALSSLVLGCLLLLPPGAARAGLPPIAAPDSGSDAAHRSDAAHLLEAAGVPSCICERELLELARYRETVAAAASLEEARERAAWPSRLARRALKFARLTQGDDTEIDRVRARLAAYEDRVATAETPESAALEFDNLVRVAGGVHVGGNSGGCNYTSTEIIAIILGFLLFIIPGIILLFVFC